MTCDLMLFEHERPCDNPKHNEALARRAAGAPKWYAIERTHEAGGFRDFLGGHHRGADSSVAIHCGEQIELQAIESRDDDFGEYTLFLDKGITVRYEANLSRSDGGIWLYTSVGGHRFQTRHEDWMRFRWPQ
jgi:frataxin-like iron-binding protein CyaY